MIPKAMTEKLETLDFFKSKNCCALKDIIKEVEKPYRTGEPCVNPGSAKGLASRKIKNFIAQPASGEEELEEGKVGSPQPLAVPLPPAQAQRNEGARPPPSCRAAAGRRHRIKTGHTRAFRTHGA